MKAPKPKKCRCGCNELFYPRTSTQVAASVQCAMKLAAQKREKEERSAKTVARREKKQALEKLKTRSDYIKELDAAFSAFIRYRDKDKPCICCGKPLGDGEIGGAFDAGHFISRRHFATRWDERNCAGQKKHCNRYLSGNYAGFREGLIERIGLDEVLRLEALKREDRHYSIQELIELRDLYRQKLKDLKKICK